MTHDEFKKWLADFCVRFPDTGQWMRSLGTETLDVWYSEFFADFDAQDAHSATSAMMHDTTLSFQKREKTIALIRDKMREIQHKRQERGRKSEERKRTSTAKRTGAVSLVANCLPGDHRRVAQQYAEWLREYRSENDEIDPPRHLKDEWLEERVPA